MDPITNAAINAATTPPGTNGASTETPAADAPLARDTAEMETAIKEAPVDETETPTEISEPVTRVAAKEAPKSVFEQYDDESFDVFGVVLHITDRIVGGQPKDPKLVEGWLGKNMGLQDEELKSRVLQHLKEMGVEVEDDWDYEKMQQALAGAAGEIKTQGFKRTPEGKPYIESRHLKAMLKESTNIVFPRGQFKFGGYVNRNDRQVGGKEPRAYVAERVFPQPEKIVIADDISGVELAIGHIEDWKAESGTRATIGYFEYVEQAKIEFMIEARKDCLTEEQWRMIWAHAQRNGLGAMRSQGYGQFVVSEWGRMN